MPPESIPNCTHRTIVPTTKGHAYNKEMAMWNEWLVRLCADHAACTLLLNQVLPTIYDFWSLIMVSSLYKSSAEVHVLEIAAILEYKAMVMYGPNPILFKTSCLFNISKPPEHYNKAIWRPDAEFWHAAMQQKMDSLWSQGVFQQTHWCLIGFCL